MSIHHLNLPWQKGRTVRSSRRQEATENLEIAFHTMTDLLIFTAKVIIDDGRSMSEIARAANVCDGTVSKLAHGVTRFPRCESILKILAVLGYRLSVRSTGQ